LIRYLDFSSQYVGTVKTVGGSAISVIGSGVADNNPEIDIKQSGNYFYISDSKYVYNMTGSDGTLSSVKSQAVLSHYSALKSWQSLNGYDSTSSYKIYISSIAVDDSKGLLYVSYTFSRSAIVVVPIHASSSAEISVLVSDGVLYSIPTSYPIPRNGLLSSSQVRGYSLVTFPMNLYFDSNDNVLYWVEVYSHLAAGTAAGALGGVALRRLQFDVNGGTVDYYAGNVGTFKQIIGRSTGYADGLDANAIFSYPVSIAFKGRNDLGPVIYVADYTNAAVRRVYTNFNSPTPTVMPTVSRVPTIRPTVSRIPTSTPTAAPSPVPSPGPSPIPSLQPTSSPTEIPSAYPSGEPTFRPTASFPPTNNHYPTSVPTALNGDCLELMLLDKFGDGWSGASVVLNHSGYVDDSYLTHPGPPPPYNYFSSRVFSPSYMSNPFRTDVCASVDDNRYRLRGIYHFSVHNPYDDDLENEWEIFWQITVRSSGEVFTGSAKTILEFEFKDSSEFKLRPIQTKLLAPASQTCARCKHPAPKRQPGKPVRELFDETQPRPPVLTKVPMTLNDKDGGGWFLTSGTGISFTVSDSSKTKLLSAGTICGDMLKEDCEIELSDGDYFFRVQGGDDYADRDGVSWNFCGVHSSAQHELSFAILDGHCIAGSLRDAVTIATLQERTNVVVQGEFLLENIFSETLSIQDVKAVESGIADVIGVSSERVSIIYYCPTESGVYCSGFSESNDRRLSQQPNNFDIGTFGRSLGATHVLDIVFTVTVVAEEYGVSGSRYHDVMELVSSQSNLLVDALTTGQLQQTIRSECRTMLSSLKYARVNEIIPMHEISLKYTYVSPEVQVQNEDISLHKSHLVVELDESAAQETVVLLPVVLVVLAVIAIYVHRQRKVINEDSSRVWRESVFQKSGETGPKEAAPSSSKSVECSGNNENSTTTHPDDVCSDIRAVNPLEKKSIAPRERFRARENHSENDPRIQSYGSGSMVSVNSRVDESISRNDLRHDDYESNSA